jgi:hypothetical protein
VIGVAGLLGFGIGCGWRFGAVTGVALSPGDVLGATVEPGVRAGVASAVAATLAARGVPAGAPIDCDIVASQLARAAVPAGSAGTVAWEARVSVRAEVAARPGCATEVEAVAVWVQPSDDAASAAAARLAATDEAARRAAERAVEVLVGRSACRQSSG